MFQAPPGEWALRNNPRCRRSPPRRSPARRKRPPDRRAGRPRRGRTRSPHDSRATGRIRRRTRIGSTFEGRPPPPSRHHRPPFPGPSRPASPPGEGPPGGIRGIVPACRAMWRSSRRCGMKHARARSRNGPDVGCDARKRNPSGARDDADRSRSLSAPRARPVIRVRRSSMRASATTSSKAGLYPTGAARARIGEILQVPSEAFGTFRGGRGRENPQ